MWKLNVVETYVVEPMRLTLVRTPSNERYCASTSPVLSECQTPSGGNKTPTEPQSLQPTITNPAYKIHWGNASSEFVGVETQ